MVGALRGGAESDQAGRIPAGVGDSRRAGLCRGDHGPHVGHSAGEQVMKTSIKIAALALCWAGCATPGQTVRNDDNEAPAPPPHAANNKPPPPKTTQEEAATEKPEAPVMAQKAPP